MTLTEFLLERIAEDEAGANNWLRFEVREGLPGNYVIRARVLRECEAKRRIVELHQVGDPSDWLPEQWACRLCQWDEDCDSPKHEHQYGAGRFPCDTLKALALPYADHPDYRDEWRL